MVENMGRSKQEIKYFLLAILVLINGKVFTGLVQHEQLDDEGKVLLSWEVNDLNGTITFEIVAETLGYVGFGISPQGGMSGADIFIAGVYSNGTSYHSDRYATGKVTPIIDDHQDWTLLSASEEGNKTLLRFSRALYTCDDQDYPIGNGTNRLIWAMGETDTVKYHKANKGTRSVNLLGAPIPEIPKGENLTSWKATVEVEIHGEESIYWCSLHKGPLLDKKHHIVAFEAVLPDAKALKYTHHFVIYNCYLPLDGSMDQTFENQFIGKAPKGDYCYKSDNDSFIGVNICKEVLYEWAKGSKVTNGLIKEILNEKTVFPSNLGYPIGEDGTNKQRYYMLELHLDNPNMEKGDVFESGVELFYTDKPREIEVGQLMIGHDTIISMLVPPNTTNFIVAGHCGSGCTSDHFPPTGIKVFNSLLHSHLTGRKLKIRHFRNNTELPWLDNDDHYDFDYQQSKQLIQEVEVLPGDHLTYECTYDSTWTNGSVVIGGLTTKQEMCVAFLWYYPKIDSLDACLSYYNYLKSFEDFGITNWTMIDGRDEGSTYILNPEYLKGDYEESMSRKFNWTEDFKKQLENKRRYTDHYEICISRKSELKPPLRSVKYPDIVEEYIPVDFCKPEETFKQAKSTNSGKVKITSDISILIFNLFILKVIN